MLEEKGYKQLPTGAYSEQIWHNEEYLIKFFKMDLYKKNQYINDYIDYRFFEYTKDLTLDIYPTIYGYVEKDFYVVRYVSKNTLWRSLKQKFTKEDIEKFVHSFYDCQRELYKKTGFIIDDLKCSNIVFHEEERKFYLVDLSEIVVFMNGFSARKYLQEAILGILDDFYKRRWVSESALNQGKRILLDKWDEGSLYD